MNDLLSTVRGDDDSDGSGAGRKSGRNTRNTNALYDGDIEEGYAPPSDKTELEVDMTNFFETVETIKADMAAIRGLQKDILASHDKGKTIVKTKAMQKHQADMQDMLNKVSTLAHRIKATMDSLDKDNEVIQLKKGQGVGTASERTRTTLTAGLKKKLKELMGEFNDLRQRIQEEYREVVERRVFTVTGQHVADDDIDQLIETGEAESIFQKAILEQGRGRVLDTLAEIQERHKAVKDLEQSLLELFQIFQDMAVLVEAQGEMLDNIEKQVARSVDYVADGVKALQEARELQRNTRKWMCCGLVILLVVALVIVLVVVKPWKFIKS